MPPGGGDLERPAPPALPLHLCQIGAGTERQIAVRGERRRRGQPVTAHVGDRLGQVMQRHRIDARQRHLARRLGRAEHELDPGPPSPLGDDERSPDRPHPAVQGQLAHGGVRPERARRKLVRGGEDGQRNRQVEAGALLAQVGRRQVDGDAPERPLQLGRDDTAADALLGLLAGAVGQPDDGEGGHAPLQMRLDFHPPWLQPDERVGQHLREHRLRLESEPSRTCRNSVPKDAQAGRASPASGTRDRRRDRRGI